MEDKANQAKQQRDLQHELNETKQSYENSAMEVISLKAQLSSKEKEAQAKHDEFLKEHYRLLNDHISCEEKIKHLKQKRNEYRAELATVQEDRENLTGHLKQCEKDLVAQAKDLKEAEQEVQKYKSFHDKALAEQKEQAKSWVIAKAAYDELLKDDKMPKDDKRANKVVRTLLDKVATSWRELGRIYETEGPAVAEAPKQGDDSNDMDLLKLFDQKTEELKAQEKDLQDLRQSLAELTRDIEQKDQEIEILRESNEKLKRELNETSVPPSRASSEALRNPMGAERDTPEHRRVSSLTSLALSATPIQMEEEIKRLEKENSDLRQKLTNKSKGKEKLNESSEKASDSKKASSSTDSSPEEAYEIKAAQEEIEKLRAQIQEQTGDIEQLNKTMSKREEQFKTEYRNCRNEANIHRNRLKSLESVNFKTADSLAQAIGNEERGVYNKSHLTLVDRINYLNLACFLRTRNYIQLALREGANRLANVLLNDAQEWTKFCHEDFAKMDPSVNVQIGASMHILYGIRKILTTKTEEGAAKARTNIHFGRGILAKHPNEFIFFQLHQLAETIMKCTEDEQGKGLYKKKPRFTLSKRLHTEKKLKSPIKRKIRANLSPKATNLGYVGLHSPLSPGK